MESDEIIDKIITFIGMLMYITLTFVVNLLIIDYISVDKVSEILELIFANILCVAGRLIYNKIMNYE